MTVSFSAARHDDSFAFSANRSSGGDVPLRSCTGVVKTRHDDDDDVFECDGIVWCPAADAGAVGGTGGGAGPARWDRGAEGAATEVEYDFARPPPSPPRPAAATAGGPTLWWALLALLEEGPLAAAEHGTLKAMAEGDDDGAAKTEASCAQDDRVAAVPVPSGMEGAASRMLRLIGAVSAASIRVETVLVDDDDTTAVGGDDADNSSPPQRSPPVVVETHGNGGINKFRQIVRQCAAEADETVISGGRSAPCGTMVSPSSCRVVEDSAGAALICHIPTAPSAIAARKDNDALPRDAAEGVGVVTVVARQALLRDMGEAILKRHLPRYLRKEAEKRKRRVADGPPSGLTASQRGGPHFRRFPLRLLFRAALFCAPGHYAAWSALKTWHLLQTRFAPRCEDAARYSMLTSSLALSRLPKCPEAFSHRQWICASVADASNGGGSTKKTTMDRREEGADEVTLSHFASRVDQPRCDMQTKLARLELAWCLTVACVVHPRSYHAWDYARFLFRTFTPLPDVKSGSDGERRRAPGTTRAQALIAAASSAPTSASQQSVFPPAGPHDDENEKRDGFRGEGPAAMLATSRHDRHLDDDDPWRSSIAMAYAFLRAHPHDASAAHFIAAGLVTTATLTLSQRDSAVPPLVTAAEGEGGVAPRGGGQGDGNEPQKEAGPAAAAILAEFVYHLWLQSGREMLWHLRNWSDGLVTLMCDDTKPPVGEHVSGGGAAVTDRFVSLAPDLEAWWLLRLGLWRAWLVLVTDTAHVVSCDASRLSSPASTTSATGKPEVLESARVATVEADEESRGGGTTVTRRDLSLLHDYRLVDLSICASQFVERGSGQRSGGDGTEAAPSASPPPQRHLPSALHFLRELKLLLKSTTTTATS